MPSYVFPGYPPFLEAAAAELGRPDSAGPARRIAALTALANLCAQAARGDAAHVGGILAKAAEFRDQIATALRAADLMLIDVEKGRRGPTPPESKAGVEAEAEPPAAFIPPSVPLSARKGPKSPKEPS